VPGDGALAQTAGSTELAPKATGPPRDASALIAPASRTKPPAGFALTANQVLATTDRLPVVVRELKKFPGSTRQAFIKGERRWQVSYFSKRDPKKDEHVGKEVVQVLVSDRTGEVISSWTGFKVAWTMARGYPGAFGRRASALYIWLPLCVLFFAPFFDWRRPFGRLLHLDLLMLLGLSVSLAFFSHGRIDWSVPLVYPFLVYLMVRMLLLARQRARNGEADPDAEPREPLRLLVPLSWLVIALIFLVGFRIGLNVTNSNVIDVGYSGVIGADRIADGSDLYGNFPADNRAGDTYGPVNYYAYTPFEQLFPWSGSWDELPAAHAAALAFDLLTMLALFLAGRMLRRGREGNILGLIFAYAWAAYPYTLFTLNSNANDSLIALLVTVAFLALAHPRARAVALALAASSKFAPLALVPLWASYDRRRIRDAIAFSLAFGATMVLAFALVIPDGGVRELWDRTVGFQLGRDSPFSVWGQEDSLGWLQDLVKAGAVLLAAAVFFVPKEKTVLQVAALGAAVLIAVQLSLPHWFYLYIVWWLPLALIALLGAASPQPEQAPARTIVQDRSRLSRSARPSPIRRLWPFRT
jgi:Ca2+/Na+ antiporter